MGVRKRWPAGACALAALAMGLFARAEPARAAEPTSVDGPAGWSVEKLEGDSKIGVCIAAQAPDSSGAQFAVSAQGPLMMLILSSPAWPIGKAAYPVEVRIDDGAPVRLNATGEGGVMGVLVGGDLLQSLSQARTVSMSVGGKPAVFPVRNARAALDAVTRCVGAPSLAERSAAPQPQAIAGAHGWTLTDNLPGAPSTCSARRNGAEVDTVLMLNENHDLVLIAGHPTWASWGGKGTAMLAVDGGAPKKVDALSLGNLVLSKVTAPVDLARLRTARTLDWTLPNGRFHAEVAGLGQALNAVIQCQAAKPRRPAG